jgi:hypothetical protein
VDPEPEERSAPWQHPVGFFVLGLVGFLLGIGLLFFGRERTGTSQMFVDTIGFAVWAGTIGVQTAYWAVTAGPLWTDLRAMWRRATASRYAVLALGIVIVGILIVFQSVSAAGYVDWPLWGHQMKTRTLTIIGGVGIGVPALMGIALVQGELGRLGSDLDDMTTVIEARSRILRFLAVAGATIGLAVLAAGALRKATVPVFVKDAKFPQEGIVLYGAFFTGLLLLVYVPAHLTLRRLGARIRDRYFPSSGMPAPDADTFKSWLDRRAALEGVLQSNVTPSQQLQASLFILAPLLSAVVTALIPKPT